MADFSDRSLGIGYPGGASILFALLVASLYVWYRSVGSVSVNSITSPKAEMFYWVTILFSQTSGTALGDWMADTNGLGYEGGALVFGAGLVMLAGLYFWTDVSRTLLFWGAFILTRPLGATVGDLLDKPVTDGGLAVSRFYASAILAQDRSACLYLSFPRSEGVRVVPSWSARKGRQWRAFANWLLVSRLPIWPPSGRERRKSLGRRRNIPVFERPRPETGFDPHCVVAGHWRPIEAICLPIPPFAYAKNAGEIFTDDVDIEHL